MGKAAVQSATGRCNLGILVAYLATWQHILCGCDL